MAPTAARAALTPVVMPLVETVAPVLDQFVGKSAADGTLTVGTNVDAITGATVSTRGITTGVNAALAAVGAIG